MYRRPNLEAVEALLQAAQTPICPRPRQPATALRVQQESADLALLLLKYKANPAPPGENDEPVLYPALSSRAAAVLIPAL